MSMTIQNQKCPAVFLDRDGTLIEDRGHLRRPAEVVFYPWTAPALRRLQPHYLLFIVTHQRGVADGELTLEEVDRVNRHVFQRLAAEGVTLTDVYCCPHRREQQCPCIKPKPFFLHQAAQRYDLDLARSFVVGDHPHDVATAWSVGATGIYVLTGHGRKHYEELPSGAVVVADLADAADWILAEGSECRATLPD